MAVWLTTACAIACGEMTNPDRRGCGSDWGDGVREGSRRESATTGRRRIPSVQQGKRFPKRFRAQLPLSTGYASEVRKGDGATGDGADIAPHKAATECGRFPTVGKRGFAIGQDRDSRRHWKRDRQRETPLPRANRSSVRTEGKPLRQGKRAALPARSSGASFRMAWAEYTDPVGVQQRSHGAFDSILP